MALNRKHDNEAFGDFKCFHVERELVSCLPYEWQMRELYTCNMFVKFQIEVKHKLNCRERKIVEVEGVYMFDVIDMIVPDGLEGSFIHTYPVFCLA